jgi:hypothetical protein
MSLLVLLALAASYPDYAEEWLSPYGGCPDTFINGTGVAVDPFNQTHVKSAADCCAFCHRQTLQRCVAWTFHPASGVCYVADRSTPHVSTGAISGAAPTPPPTPLPEPNPPLGYQPSTAAAAVTEAHGEVYS